MRWMRCIKWGLGFVCVRVVWSFVVVVIMGTTDVSASGSENPAWVDALSAASFFDMIWIQPFGARLIPDDRVIFSGLGLFFWGLVFWETFLVGFLGTAAVQTVMSRVKGHGADGSRPVTVKGIPSPVYEQIITDLGADGWERMAVYTGFDAGIDYDSVTLKKQEQTLKFKWEPYFEGRITGPKAILAKLRDRYLKSGVGENKQ